MRIGFDAKRFFHNNTGLGNFSRSLVNGFAEQHPEHEYVLFSPSTSSRPVPDGVAVVEKRRFRPFWRQFGIASSIERKKIDVYHGLSGELPYSRPQSIPQVVTIHDLIFAKYPQYYKTLDRLIYAHKTSHALRMADVVIASSQRTKKDLEELTGSDSSKIQVVYQDCHPDFYRRMNEADLSEIRNRLNLPKNFFLLISKFEKRKNHLRFLQAYKNSEIDAPIVMVGRPGDTYSDVLSLISKLKLESSVHVKTDLTTSDLKGLIQLTDGSIFPSEYEGFGIPVLESLAGGCPVLTSTDSSMQEISGNAGMYFDPHSIESMSKALKDFGSESVLQGLKANIESRLPDFSNKNILNQHLSIYQSLLK